MNTPNLDALMAQAARAGDEGGEVRQRNCGIYRYRVPHSHATIMRRLRREAKRIRPHMLVCLT
jgi:hypothetical protein